MMGGSVIGILVFFFISFPILVVCLTSASFARAAMGEKLGDPTPRLMGRVTLNPFAHIDAIGVLLMVLTCLAGFGIGFTKPVPMNRAYYRDYRMGTILFALSGAIMNACLGMMGLGLMFVLFKAQITPPALLLMAMNYWVALNTVLVFFNMLPIPGYYGGLIVAELLPPHMGRQFDSYAQYSMIIFFMLFFVGFYNRLWLWSQMFLGWAVTGLLGGEFAQWAGLALQ
jgi:Zn-dependent protease